MKNPNKYGPLLKTAFDIDGVLNDTRHALVQALYDLCGISFKVDDWTKYRMEDCVDIPDAKIRDVIDAALSRRYFDLAKPMEDMINVIMMLFLNTDKVVPLITTRRDEETTKEFLDSKIIKGKFPYFLVTLADATDGIVGDGFYKLDVMEEIGCSLLVEDSPFTVELFWRYCRPAILVDRIYNRDCRFGLRVYNPWDIYYIALTLEGGGH